MPLKKISDLPTACTSPDHNPPTHICLENGVYEHTCSQCGHKTVFTVRGPTFTNVNPNLYRTTKVDGIMIHLGSFGREDEAAMAYDRAARHYFGGFARTNFQETL